MSIVTYENLYKLPTHSILHFPAVWLDGPFPEAGAIPGQPAEDEEQAPSNLPDSQK